MFLYKIDNGNEGIFVFQTIEKNGKPFGDGVYINKENTLIKRIFSARREIRKLKQTISKFEIIQVSKYATKQIKHLFPEIVDRKRSRGTSSFTPATHSPFASLKDLMKN